METPTTNKGWIRKTKKKQRVCVEGKEDKIANDNGGNLSLEQRRAVSLVLSDRKSIFLTGAAGTGKSVVLQEISKRMRPPLIAVTASTGVAAARLLDGAQTIHSWSGLGSSLDARQVLEDAGGALERWRLVQVLVIDEVSMVSRAMFECLHTVACKARRSNLPFGGITMVLVGDFLQLGPVHESGFCFLSPIWRETIPEADSVVALTCAFRQGEDVDFAKALGELRIGYCSPTTLALFRTRETESWPRNNRQLYLQARRVDVKSHNVQQLKRMPPGSGVKYAAEQVGNVAEIMDCPAEEVLCLKRGCRVMLLVNLNVERGLTNGAMGTVVAFDDQDPDLPVVEFDNGTTTTIHPFSWILQNEVDRKVIASISQIPLSLAWSVTIHRAQGLTLDSVLVSMENIFAHGQGYVALSRARRLSDICIAEAFSPKSIHADPMVLKFYGIERPQQTPSLGALQLLGIFSNVLKNKVFIVTGELESMTREECHEILQNNGAKVVVTLAKKLTHAIVGKKAGPIKIKHFAEHRIETWTEEKLINIVK